MNSEFGDDRWIRMRLFTSDVTKVLATCVMLIVFFTLPSHAQVIVTTVAGDGNAAHTDGIGASAQFNTPNGIELGPDNHLYVADWADGYIRKISPSSVVTSIAGNGSRAVVDGTGTNAAFTILWGLGGAPDGTMYTFDYDDGYIRKITPTGQVTTLAGCGHHANGDGPAGVGCVRLVTDLDADAAGIVYFVDGWGSSGKIRKIAPNGTITSVTLTGPPAVQSIQWQGITVLPNGTVYIADHFQHRIWEVSPSGQTSLLAGSTQGYADGAGATAQFDTPSGLDHDAAGNIYVADTHNNRIRKITPSGVVTTIAGNGIVAHVDGAAAMASFASPKDVAVHPSGQTIYVNDQDNHIRKIFCENGEDSPTSSTGFENICGIPPPSGPILKICKVAGDGVDIGTEFSFDVTGANGLTSVPAGPAPGGYCAIVDGSFQEGSMVDVDETLPPGYGVLDITGAPSNRLVSVDLDEGLAVVEIGPGVTEVTYMNEKRTGYLEICKYGEVEGEFSFNIQPGNIQTAPIPVRTCTPVIEVPAGEITITELPSAGSVMSGCATYPSSREILCSPADNSFVVEVTVGDISTQTIAVIGNARSDGRRRNRNRNKRPPSLFKAGSRGKASFSVGISSRRSLRQRETDATGRDENTATDNSDID